MMKIFTYWGIAAAMLTSVFTEANAKSTPQNYGTSADAPESGMFDENRVLSYRVHRTMTDLSESIISAKFEGTETVDGTEYHRLVITRNVIFDLSTQEWSDVPAPAPVLVREAEGKVFARVPLGYWLDGTSVAESNLNKEVELYDFNCTEGDSFTSIDDYGQTISLMVENVESVNIAGAELRKLLVSELNPGEESGTFEVIENVGVVNQGFFAYFNSIRVTGCGTPPYNVNGYIYGTTDNISLLNISDPEGNLLYGSPLPDSIIGGIEGIVSDESGNESKDIYDITGNKVKDMQHGGIYICNGKKIIAK